MSTQETVSEQWMCLRTGSNWVQKPSAHKTVLFGRMTHGQLIISAEREEMQTLKRNSEQSFEALLTIIKAVGRHCI